MLEIDEGKTDKTHPFQDPTFRGSWSGRERKCLFVKPAAEKFFELGYSLGLDSAEDGRAAVPVDFDGDGDLDLAVFNLQGLRLFENRMPAKHFARIRLAATKGDAQALGAHVRLEAGGVKQQDYVKATTGFASQVPLDLHFGLGAATKIDRLTVRWGDGTEQLFQDLPADKLLVVTQGVAQPAASDLPRWPQASRPRVAAAHAAKASVDRLEGGKQPLTSGGAPAVVNFWSPSSAPCRAELGELAKLASHVAVVGVLTDPAQIAEARAMTGEMKLSLPQFVANAELLRSFFGSESEMPVPSTFIFDGDGRLRRAFFRAVSNDEVDAVIGSFGKGVFSVDHVQAALFHIDRKEFDAAERELAKALASNPDHASAHFNLGLVRGLQNRHADAVESFRKSLQLDPTHGRAAHNLAVALQKLKNFAEAESAAREATRLDPTYAESHRVLGQVLAESGRLDAAVDPFKESVRLAPGVAGTHADLGRVYLALKRKPEAIAALERALQLNPALREAQVALDGARRK